MFKETLNRSYSSTNGLVFQPKQYFLLFVFSERDVKKNILCGDYGADAMQIEKKFIQGTFKCRIEMIPIVSHWPETKSMFLFSCLLY